MTSTPLLTLPPGWHHHPDPAPDVLVAARGGPALGSGVAPELVLRRAELPDRLRGDLAGWRAAAVADLARLLDSFALEDTEQLDLEGREVLYQRFAHRGVGVELLTEQWSWQVGAWGLTLTGTVALEDYADLCEVLEDAAASVEPGALMSAV
ncbi:hypothetical protein [Nocardioides marmotae]|uniref:Uncharacterized protein n=1 Tax=Nocardioides marmotae TaxID=2663857 RepID=A0A6I3JF48_9ACTN|nr:hypothetical protein [Nocardioides marmotae]MCR6033179.1 hypothetical protein [Gordonia jinghuaiqii]MBC9732685.1 hypothetical protein [Nocardioides marmotae]MTB83802.1 hypothetical protein [Nocardioides marmotae]MTB96834.1 hypothetical protein [Nocardioides marmotae]QKE02964.1 hypothetical protein HPC71_19315 [Nocardioides marmotae]